MILVRIVAPHFVAGVVIDQATRRVVEAAPIVRYSIGWDAERLRRYVDAKRWQAVRVSPGVAPTRTEGSAVMHQWPDPNETQPIQQPPGEAPSAPHAPEPPIETPEPRDAPAEREGE